MAIKQHDITPDISLMPKLGKSGYSSPQAIAELVDNAIDERIDKQILEINIKVDKNVISVADNGSGMNDIKLAKALTLAHSEKQNKLGEYGLGLKTACTSLGRSFEIITSPDEDERQYRFIYDEDEWFKGKRDWKIDIESTKIQKDFHFTIIKITKLNQFWPQLAEKLKNDLERRYTPYIKNGEVKIRVNGKICQSTQYAILDDSKKEFEIKISNGPFKNEQITGWYGLLKEGSNKGYYGFHTYRRGRMITTYDKIAIGEHPTISRIIGEINLDFVPVTHNKREFIKESNEYIEAEKYLKEEFKDLLKEARKKSNLDRITPQAINEINIWQEKISQAIVQSKELKAYTSVIDSKTGMIKSEDGEYKEIPGESRNKGELKGSVIPQHSQIQRLPKQINEKKKKILKVKGVTFEFEHEFSSLGSESSWKEYDFDKKSTN